MFYFLSLSTVLCLRLHPDSYSYLDSYLLPLSLPLSLSLSLFRFLSWFLFLSTVSVSVAIFVYCLYLYLYLFLALSVPRSVAQSAYAYTIYNTRYTMHRIQYSKFNTQWSNHSTQNTVPKVGCLALSSLPWFFDPRSLPNFKSLPVLTSPQLNSSSIWSIDPLSWLFDLFLLPVAYTTYLHTYLANYLLTCLPALPTCLPCPPTCLTIYLPAYPPIYLPTYRSTYLTTYLPI